MKINHTISVSKTLRDLCSIRQKTKVKNTFTNIVYNFLVVKTSCNNIERYAYEQMVHKM